MKHHHVEVRLAGILGETQLLSEQVRLREFIQDADSEPLALFAPEHRDQNRAGDWYGEHVGKWLVSATRAAHRTQDPEWDRRLGTVIEFLAGQQEPTGYLGTYAPDAPGRFTHPDVSRHRTWDLWVHAWMIVGLAETTSRDALRGQSIEILAKIGDLLIRTFRADPAAVLRQGNHRGLSSLVILEPLARLYELTGQSEFAQMGLELIEAANAQGLPFLANPAVDPSQIGTGKIYQILWCLRGILALTRQTQRDDLVTAVEQCWRAVRDHHLTPFGGPWGGIAAHKEVFNPAGFFSPTGMVETCSSATWLTLSQDLFLATGDATYLEQAELTSVNAILGAMDANGYDWCYFTFPNGRRNNTYAWACCKSSGALAVESLSRAVLTEADDGVHLNQWFPLEAELPDGVRIELQVHADRLWIHASAPVRLWLRIPSWAKVDDALGSSPVRLEVGPNGLGIPYRTAPVIIPWTYTVDHHGQEIVREDYAYVKWGPWVYATGKYHGDSTHQTVRLPRLQPDSALDPIDSESLLLRQAGRSPIRLEPYYRAGGRHDGGWRFTWLEVAWQ